MSEGQLGICKNCRYWKRDGRGLASTFGWCRFHAPVPVSDENFDQWPYVDREDMCGEFLIPLDASTGDETDIEKLAKAAPEIIDRAVAEGIVTRGRLQAIPDPEEE